MFESLARAPEHWVDEVKPQELTNTAWAFAKADQSDATLFVVLTRAAERPLLTESDK